MKITRFVPAADDRKHTRHLQHLPALPSVNPHENIIGKQGQLNRHSAAVRPVVDLRIQGQEILKFLLEEPVRNLFFVMRTGEDRKPGFAVRPGCCL